MSNGETNLAALEASAKKSASDAEKSANNAKKAQAAAEKAKKDADKASKGAVTAQNAAQKAEKGAIAAQKAADKSDKSAVAARQAAEKARDDAGKARDDAIKARNDATKARDDAGKARDDATKARDDAGKARDDATKARDDIMATNTAHHEQTEASMSAHAWALLDTIAMVTRTDADNAVHEAEDAARRAQRATEPVVEDLETARHDCDTLLTLTARHSSDAELIDLQLAASKALEQVEHDVTAATEALASAETSRQSALNQRDGLAEAISARLGDREARPDVDAVRAELFDARATVLAAAADAAEAATLAEDSALRAAETLQDIQTMVEDATQLHPVSQQNPVNTRDDIRSLFFGRPAQSVDPVDEVVEPEPEPEPTDPEPEPTDPEPEPEPEPTDPEPEPEPEPPEPGPWYWWHRVDGHGIPDGALPAGEFTERGEVFYIAQIEHHGGVHTGKVWGRFGEARIPYGGMEIVTRDFSVLMARPGAPFFWESASNGTVPSGAFKGGHESNGTALYIARAPYGGDGIHPGKVRKAFRAANIGWGGKEVKVNPYEVLVFDETRVGTGTDTSTPQDEAPSEPEPVHAEPIHAEPIHAEPIHAEPIHAEPIHAEPEPIHAEPIVDEAPPDPVRPEPEPVQAAPDPAPVQGIPQSLPTNVDAIVKAQLDALESMMSTPIDNRSALRSMFNKFNF